MSSPPPTREIRDALGAVRLLYAARLARGGPGAGEAGTLRAAGGELAAALRACEVAAGDAERAGAVERAAAALFQLEAAIGIADGMREVAEAARERVRRSTRRRGARVDRKKRPVSPRS